MTDDVRISTPSDAPEISGTRLFDAPRALVFDAFSSADRLARWFGPKGFSLTTQSFEFAPGGVWRFVMHGPDGREYENKIVFREIVRPERVSYVHPGDDGAEPVRMEVTVSFSQEGAKTRIDWRMRFPTLAERDRVEREYGAAQGLAETLTRLGELVEESNGPVFVTSRRLEVSRETLWKALTEPERMKQWFGPKGVPVIAAEMDFRPPRLLFRREPRPHAPSAERHMAAASRDGLSLRGYEGRRLRADIAGTPLRGECGRDRDIRRRSGRHEQRLVRNIRAARRLSRARLTARDPFFTLGRDQ